MKGQGPGPGLGTMGEKEKSHDEVRGVTGREKSQKMKRKETSKKKERKRQGRGGKKGQESRPFICSVLLAGNILL